jgi:hypothetical protein
MANWLWEPVDEESQMNTDALVVGLSSFLGVAVYLYVGGRLSRRASSPETRVPALQFALFWIGLAASTALGGVESLLAVFGTPPLAVVVAFMYYDIAVVAVALWGLISYLYFLYTGRSGFLPVTFLYVLEYGLLVYYTAAGNPNGVTVVYGSPGLTFRTPLVGPITDLAVLILVIPEFVAGFAYLRLYFRSHDRTVRYRIALVSGGILGWFFLDLLSLGARSGGNPVWLLVGQLLLFAAALTVVIAYYPPRYVRERFGIAAISETAKVPTS